MPLLTPARLCTLALLTAMAPAAAQELPKTPKQKAVSATALPEIVAEAREVGVKESAIQSLLDGLRNGGVAADDAESLLRVEVEAVKAGAPKENFGAVVQAQLARGLRGRELSAAIRAEHQRRGIGKPEQAGQGAGSKGGKKKP